MQRRKLHDFDMALISLAFATKNIFHLTGHTREQNMTYLVSHVASAGLEPTPVTAVKFSDLTHSAGGRLCLNLN